MNLVLVLIEDIPAIYLIGDRFQFFCHAVGEDDIALILEFLDVFFHWEFHIAFFHGGFVDDHMEIGRASCRERV